MPSLAWAWDKTYIFLDGTILPQIRIIYAENVEPQLAKIGKRLGRYSSGKKSVPKSVSEGATSASAKTTSSFTRPAPSVTVSSSAASTAVAPTSTVKGSSTQTSAEQNVRESTRSKSIVDPVSPPDIDEHENEDPVRREARETVAADLKDWQERYAKAADEGAAEIDERVQEIAKKMIRRNARVTGKALLEELSNASVSQLVNLRRDIIQIVSASNRESTAQDQEQDKILDAVRHAGLAVKDKAQEIRRWRESYESEMQGLITKAAETHFSILENIRDLALQKIGMKWAWMDGVTYKDWAKYHLLKSRFDEWKRDLENLIVTHPSLEAAQLEASSIENSAMKIAATTAKELARLKQVATWKLVAGDDSDEFDSSLMQQAAESVESARLAAANVINNVAESAESAQEAVVNKINEGASAASEAAAKATKGAGKVYEGVQIAAESVLNQKDTATATSADAEALSAASEEIANVVEPTSDATPEDDVSKPHESPESVEPDFASAVIIDTPVVVGNATEVEEDVKADPAPVELPLEDDEDDAKALEARPPADPAPTLKPVLFGAAAQWVPSRVPILDDEDEDDDSVIDVVQQELRSAYSAAMSRADVQYSKALSAVSAQIRGTPQPAHEKVFASVTAAYSKAMASASARMESALKAVSANVKATPTKKNTATKNKRTIPIPTADWTAVESIAAERLAQGRAWAEEQYESAKIAIGLATPTPSTPAEHVNRLLNNAKYNYYAGLGVAQARYTEFLDAASSAFSSMTATPTPTDFAGTASSIASVARESAASVAAAASEGAASAGSVASSAAAVAGENASSIAAAGYEKASAVADQASSAAAAAGENVSSVAAAGYEKASAVADQASSAFGQASAAAYDQAFAAADYVLEGWDVIVTKISLQVYGAPTPTPWYEAAYSGIASVTSLAGEAAATATSAAAVASDRAVDQYAAVSSIVSELLVGKEPTFSESVVSKLKQAYATGSVVVGDAGEKVKSVGEKVKSAVGEGAEAVKEKVVGHDEL